MDIIKCALQHFVMKVGCYVTDDGANYVTFHELNRKITKAQLDSVSNREF